MDISTRPTLLERKRDGFDMVGGMIKCCNREEEEAQYLIPDDTTSTATPGKRSSDKIETHSALTTVKAVKKPSMEVEEVAMESGKKVDLFPVGRDEEKEGEVGAERGDLIAELWTF